MILNELAIQANLIAADYNGFDRTYLSTAEKKFAELIIKECAATALALQNWPASEPHHCAEDILIHFGLST
jgi:hypothetical protein